MTKLNDNIQNGLIDTYLLPAGKTGRLELPKTNAERESYLKLAEENKLSAQLYLQLSKMKIADTELMEPLKKIYDRIKDKNEKRLEAGLPVLLDMQKQGIEVIILKGNAIAEDYFGDIGYKPMNDIDFLIRKSDIEKTLKVFSEHKLLSAAPLEEDVHKQSRMSHHAPPFFTKSMNVFFGTHWDIAAPTRGIKIPLEDFWGQKEEFQLQGKTFYRLCPLHFVFHLCVHLSAAKTGLREIGDIVKVLQFREKDISARELTGLARKAQAQEEIYEAFALIDSVISFDVVRQTMDELRKDLSASSLERIAKRTSSRLKILHLRTNYISKIEKTFAFFMMSEDPLEKTLLLARMWKLYLFVPMETALKLSYEMQDVSLPVKMISLIKAPAKISRVFIKDLGLFIFIFVTARHQWVLLRSYGEYLLKKMTGKRVKKLKDFANDLGLSMAEIKELQALD